MVILAFSSAALAFLLILVLYRNTLVRLQIKSNRIEGVKSRSRYVDEELELNFLDRFVKPTLKKLSARLSKLSQSRRQKTTSGQKGSSELEKSLRLAGLRMSTQEFFLIRILSAFGLLFLGFAGAGLLSRETDIQLLIVLFGMTIGLISPTFILRSLVRSRQSQIENQLPTIMDVLSVSIEAGLGFDAAILKVIERYEGPLIDELALLYREIQMGKPRREALTSLAERSSVSELQTFATAIIQADQFGSPIKNVLFNQAIQLRLNRRQQAQEKGMKAPVKMVVPMVLFIFPVIFIVLLGPTVISMIEQFG